MRSLRYRDVPPATPAPKSPAERVVREIRRATRKHHSAEERIRIVPEGLLGENSIVALYRSEGIAEGLYYSWLKDVLEAGKRRLSGDTVAARLLALADEGVEIARFASLHRVLSALRPIK